MKKDNKKKKRKEKRKIIIYQEILNGALLQIGRFDQCFNMSSKSETLI